MMKCQNVQTAKRAYSAGIMSKFISGFLTVILMLSCMPMQIKAKENTNGVITESEYNPCYTIQHYLNYPMLELDIPESNLSGMDLVNAQASDPSTMIVWRTDGERENTLPRNFEEQTSYGQRYDKDELYEQSPHSQVSLNADGTLKTENVLRKLFADEETRFFEKSQMRFMNKLYNNENEDHYNKNYTLRQVWLLKEGRDKDSTNEADFYILDAPIIVVDGEDRHDPSKFTFTNYKDNPAFKPGDTINENGVKYVGNPADGYTILITENTVIRLIFEPTTEENYEYDAVNFFDYDISDGWIYTTDAAAQIAKNGGDVANISDMVDAAIEQGTLNDLIKSSEFNGKLPTSYQGIIESQNPNVTFYANTVKQGINNPKNLLDPNNQAFAFGNSNAGTELGSAVWNDPNGVPTKLNMSNSGNRAGTNRWGGKFYGPSLRGATFSLAQGVNPNGSINWNDGVNAPPIFSTAKEDLNPDGINNPDGIQGKTAYLQYSAYGTENTQENYSLQFSRRGGTYTLSGVKKNDGTQVSGELDKFRENASNIYSNEFWPMDSASSFGTDGHDLKFGNKNLQNNRRHIGGVLPTSDDEANDHNSYFGMTTYFDFVLQPGYCGPLNYFFYGDDDLLVFLSETTVSDDGTVTVKSETTQQVADIGGVHSSVGMYVTLWDFIDGAEEITNEAGEKIATGIPYGGETKTYRLSVYYTERGASGSSCYMRFSIPFEELAIDPIIFDQEVQIEKIVKDYSEEDKGVYAFQLDLTSPDGKPMVNQYPYKRYDANGDEISTSNASIVSGTKFFLKDGERILISHLPEDTAIKTDTDTKEGGDTDEQKDYKYTVTELGKVDPNSTGYPDSLAPNHVTVIPLHPKDSTTFMTGTIKDGLGQNLTLGTDYGDEFDQNNYVRFINAEEPGMLELEKHLSVDTESTDKDFNFDVEFKKADGTPLNSLSWLKSPTVENPNWVEQPDITLEKGNGELVIKSGEKVLIYNLPEGATYTITEAKDTYYGVQEINITGNGKAEKDEASGKVTGTIIVDDTVTDMEQKQPSNTIKYVNAKIEPGNLTVTKQVTGTDGDKDRDFQFTITLDDTAINGKFGEMEFTGGVAGFTLKHSESKT
ncbi:MAG: hypothetical protein HFJ84_05075, partial [Clostridiales bacterium]|nr:hypothetical protein [Clostridiales bacterium]